MRLGFSCLAVSALIVACVWAWLGTPVPMPPSPLAPGEKLYCLSYAPFHGSQSPFDPATHISAAQIDRDLPQLAKLTDCVRTYATDYGGELVPGIAARHGLKVILGIWLSSHPEKNREQIKTGVALAKRYPDTIRAVVVGNEVLLRGDMSVEDLAKTIRAVKAEVPEPVTYADVWEYWVRNPELASAVDFVTVHILPYWEDFPIPARQAAAHVDAIYRRVTNIFPGKKILIGEMGWPSAGRMREGALPSPANQALVIQSVLALARAEKFHVNIIEAYDQPWKRALEGTAGGYWGLISDRTRKPKFAWGQAVSNHPFWQWQAGGGIAFVLIVFGIAFVAVRRKPAPPKHWLAVTGNALAGGILIGWTVATVPMESLGLAGWLRMLAWAGVALLSAPIASAAIMTGTPIPCFSRLIGPESGRIRTPLGRALGFILIAIMLLAVLSTLGLVFDPRYRDFPFAPLTAAAVPYLTHTLTMPRPAGNRGVAEKLAALLLALSASYIVFNESVANWQSLWFCGALLVLAISLVQVRDGQSSIATARRPAPIN